jgi:hypothetical protein
MVPVVVSGCNASEGRQLMAAQLHLWRRCAKIVQRPLAKHVRVSLAFFRQFDDFLGDYRDDRIVSIRKSEGRTRHFECDAHDALGLGVEFEAI